MNALFKRPVAPLCAACLRNLANAEPQAFASPFWIQARGKKKLPKEQNILVKLLADIPGYGRKGSIMSIARGRMRNLWYPNGNAAYVTYAQRKLVRDQVQERDSTFMMDTREKEDQKDQAQLPEVKVDFLAPERSLQVLEEVMPEYIEFSRRRISPIESRLPDPSASDEGVERLGSEKIPPEEDSAAIFGSVSTSDIAESIRALLAMRASTEGLEDAARVILTADDITINPPEPLRASVEGSRIKGLGEFDIKIRVRGGDSVERKVRVTAEIPS